MHRLTLRLCHNLDFLQFGFLQPYLIRPGLGLLLKDYLCDTVFRERSTMNFEIHILNFTNCLYKKLTAIETLEVCLPFVAYVPI